MVSFVAALTFRYICAEIYINTLKKEELIYEDESIFSCSVGVFVGYDVLWQQEGGRGKFGNDHASL